MKLLFAVLALVIIVSATTTIYFTYYTATFYTTDVSQLENKVASLESKISSLKSSTASDLKNAYDDGYSAGIAEQSSSSNTSSSNTFSSNTDAVSSITRTIGTVEESGFSQDCAVSMGGDGCYTPVNLSANVGDKIIMTNTDSTGVHSFTSGTVDGFTPIPAGMFDSEVLMPGDAYERKFSQKGTYDYYCMLHTWMTGKIIVE